MQMTSINFKILIKIDRRFIIMGTKKLKGATMYAMSYSLKSDDVDKIIQGIKTTFKGNDVISAYLTNIEGSDKFRFVYDFNGFGSLIFNQNENDVYCLNEMKGKVKDLLCISFNAYVKEYAGKDWPTSS